MRSLVKGVVRSMLAGLAAVLIIGGHARDAGALCNAAVDFMFVGGPNFVVPGDATRDTVRLRLTLGAGFATRCPTPPGCQLTLNRLRERRIRGHDLGVQQLGKRHVARIIRREVVPQAQDPLEEAHVAVAPERKQ